MRDTEPQPTLPAFVFGGFDNPNTTQVPDAFFDVVAPQLSEAELRVALYIIRRTFGFKKDSDTISLRQMVDGITTRDGRVLDRGTGLRKSAVANALNGLERKGIILSQRNCSRERGNEPTTYALNIKNHPLSVPVDKGLSIHADKPLSVPVDTQYTERQQTVLQQTENSISFELVANMQKSSESQNSKKRDKVFETSRDNNAAAGRPRRSGSREFTTIGQVLANTRVSSTDQQAPSRPKKGPRTAEIAEDEPYSISTHNGLSTRPRGRPPKATEQIEHVLGQISDEFHDAEHLPSNIGQAARLWRSSGLEESAFVSRLYEARAITKDYGMSIHKKASGEEGKWGMRNRMPYFFAVVRDLLGMKDDRVSQVAST